MFNNQSIKLDEEMAGFNNDRFRSGGTEARHGALLREVLRLLEAEVLPREDEPRPVVRWREPLHLQELLDLEPRDEGVDDVQLLRDVRNTLHYSVKVGHPRFVNQLFSSLDLYGFIGQLLTDCLNPSVYTYEVAPVFTLMEMTVLRRMRSLVGFQHGDGLFCPGGSFANGFAINLARFHFDPTIKVKGQSKRLVLFTSAHAHYSAFKLSALCGLGEDNVVLVPTDEVGRMRPDLLKLEIERCLCEGALPFMIYATSGTTVLGAFDPLEPLAVLRDEYKLWLHVDAAWGGGLLFSQKHKHLLQGIHLADSVTWNPHKLLAVPQQCSVLLTPHQDILRRCHGREAEYLFQKDKWYDPSWDVGDGHIQCGRRADVCKFWFTWRAKGTSGFERHVDHLMDLSQHLLTRLKASSTFEVIIEPSFVNVCFWIVPPDLIQHKDHPDYFQMLHKVAPLIKARMMRRGSMMLNYQPLGPWPNFFRFVVQNSSTTCEDVDFMVDELERLAGDVHSPLL